MVAALRTISCHGDTFVLRPKSPLSAAVAKRETPILRANFGLLAA
jgi:hypothetical protein